jgi:crotonobetainyl-CoA:carnitine CoA-transferase CaiB-like acyl-CoA transferase
MSAPRNQTRRVPALPYLVVELGTRIGCGACGSLLAQLGATVVFVEADPAHAAHGKFLHRTSFLAGKRSAEPDGALRDLVAHADAILVSSDLDPPWIATLVAMGGPTICDITAFGGSGPLAGQPFSDGLVQAMAGVMDTTGRADGPPRAIGAPVLEFLTGLYAASALIASLGTGRRGERIDMALYDCGVCGLTTFLPSHFGGGRPRRLGNRHAMAAPWNSFRCQDGWVLICATDDRQWQRICAVMRRSELAADPAFATLGSRMANRDALDAIIDAWCASQSVEQAVAALTAQGIACGPIVAADALAQEPNIRHRRVIRRVSSTQADAAIIPAPLIRFGGSAEPAGATSFQERGAAAEDRAPAHDEPREGLPLAGIQVVEIGQYTTAPLAGRQLAMLGATVVKIEPPDGDPARLWAPHNGGLSYFFVLSNSGKESIAVDLRQPEGAAYLRRLLARSDVLIENMKPGSLARLGFDPGALRAINPRLIYCAISGFGADAAYPQRPALDTVIQAMSGLMDLTRDGDLPLKAGISVADICGGALGLLAVLAALTGREHGATEMHIDLAMQDATAWLTQLSWNGHGLGVPRALPCADGFVAVDADVVLAPDEAAPAPETMRAELLQHLAARGVAAAPVQTIAEVVDHPQTCARQLIAEVQGAGGITWPLLRSPLRFETTQTRVGDPIGLPSPWTATVSQSK